MKIYISSAITNDPNYKEKFERAEKALLEMGHVVMNPAILPSGFEHHEYMHVCYPMVDVCEGVIMWENWQDSKGANLEREYGIRNGKIMFYSLEEVMSHSKKVFR